MMPKQQVRITHYIILAGCCLILLAGCSRSLDIMGGQSDEKLFTQGMNYYEQGNYKKALEHFLYVKDNYLRSSYAGLTRFYAGESYFALKDYEDASIEYKSFLSFFPSDSHAPAAQYKLGSSYLKQSLKPDRDQTLIQTALTELQLVRENYPDNEEYIRKADEQIQRTQEKMALHEYLVSEFYRKEKQYESSNHRLAYLLEHYPGARISADAFFMSGLNYLDLDQPEKAKEPFIRVLQYYPEHQEASQARQKLARLGVTEIPESEAQSTALRAPETETVQQVEPQAQPTTSEGYVVLIRENRVFIDLIRADGIREGMILEVYRENQLIGTLRISEIQDGFSIGQIESLSSGMMIQEEDVVIIPK